ncbi:MAG: hypothetical protein Q9220_000567 [cf. Caloplaca sp. 1 TL-2023]
MDLEHSPTTINSNSTGGQRQKRSSNAAQESQAESRDAKAESQIQAAHSNDDLHGRQDRGASSSSSNGERNGPSEADKDTLKEYQSIGGAKDRQMNGRMNRLQHSRSYGDGHGFVCFSDDEDDVEEARRQGNAEEKEFEVRWEGDDDPMNPRSMSKARKWSIVLIASSSSACVYVLTFPVMTFISPGLGLIAQFYGRKPIYVVSFTMFLIWLVPCAVAQNIQTMLIARFLDGVAGSAFLSVAGGTIGDMFDRSELQGPMMIYSASPFIGPPIGPLVAGFINYFTSW